MTRCCLILLLTGGTWLAMEHSALAQQPGGSIVRPTFSPYLNLLRRGNPAVNYYGLVRPEVEFRNSVNQMQQQLNSVQSTVDQEANNPNAVTTGHRTQFQSYGHYYPAKGGAGGGGSAGRGVVAPTYSGGAAATLGGGTRPTGR